MRRTKILATLGPASSDEKVIEEMVRAGCDGFRLNFSHGSHSHHAALAEMVRNAADRVRRPVAILQDLQGPKVRLRETAGGQLELARGAVLKLADGTGKSTSERLNVDEPLLVESVTPSTRLFLGDGDVQLEVLEMGPHECIVRVLEGGTVRSGAGVTAPGLNLPGGLTEKDQNDLLAGRKIGVDYVAQSFVSSAADVADAVEFLAGKGENTPILAKIERLSGLRNLEEIIRVAGGILVARGDLGIALAPEQVPVATKRILRSCLARGVLSVTATQMLESMVKSPRPTRAETSDVANAIVDGSHVVMLSGETAIGVDPPRAVRTMARIAEETERAIVAGELSETWKGATPDRTREDAIAHAAVFLGDEIRVKAIVSFTQSGSTARRVAKFRPSVGIVAATPDDVTLRRLALVWGVIPYRVAEARTLDEMVWTAEDAARAAGLVREGDAIVVTAGDIGVPGSTNLVRVANVR